MSGLLIGLATTSFSLKAQSIQLTETSPKVSSFQLGAYVNNNKNLMVFLGSIESKRLSVTLKGPKETILYRTFIKGGSANYKQKFNFEEAQSGVYELEVSDGSQTVVRKVEVIDLPAVEPQRLITYGLQASF